MLLALLIGLALIGDQIRVTWDPHPDNYRVAIVYDCAKDNTHGPFRAVNVFFVEPHDRGRLFRRVPTPVGQKCFITAQIQRRPTDWDGSEDTLEPGEYQIIAHTEEDASASSRRLEKQPQGEP